MTTQSDSTAGIITSKGTSAGVNGFGRFGLHLLKYWVDRAKEARFKVDYINDDTLSIEQAIEIIATDPYVVWNKYKVQRTGDAITILAPDGSKQIIRYSKAPYDEVPWLGEPAIVFECSGKQTIARSCAPYLVGNTELVIVSATSWDADQTLVYGFNHDALEASSKVISYGSCTVNAYVPLAAWIDQAFGILGSDVNVIHNIQAYRLDDNFTLIRKFCTLEKSAKKLLPFARDDNFIVNYTVVPYSGVSMIDFRFRLARPEPAEAVLARLEAAATDGPLRHLYGFDDVDLGPERYNCTTFSTVFIREDTRVLGDNLYLHGYFDNENSVNRFYDLVQHICRSRS